MLVQYTPISALPQDARERLKAKLRAMPLVMDNNPLLFEGYYISPSEIQSVQQQVKAAVSKRQNLFE